MLKKIKLTKDIANCNVYDFFENYFLIDNLIVNYRSLYSYQYENCKEFYELKKILSNLKYVFNQRIETQNLFLKYNIYNKILYLKEVLHNNINLINIIEVIIDNINIIYDNKDGLIADTADAVAKIYNVDFYNTFHFIKQKKLNCKNIIYNLVFSNKVDIKQIDKIKKVC